MGIIQEVLSHIENEIDTALGTLRTAAREQEGTLANIVEERDALITRNTRLRADAEQRLLELRDLKHEVSEVRRVLNNDYSLPMHATAAEVLAPVRSAKTAQRQRDAAYGILMAMKHRDLPDGPCWCFLWPDEEAPVEATYSHALHCIAARALLLEGSQYEAQVKLQGFVPPKGPCDHVFSAPDDCMLCSPDKAKLRALLAALGGPDRPAEVLQRLTQTLRTLSQTNPVTSVLCGEVEKIIEVVKQLATTEKKS